MKRLTRFEIMRRNRSVLEEAAKALEADQAWAAQSARFLDERTESFEDTRDWLADTREQARVAAAAMPGHAVQEAPAAAKPRSLLAEFFHAVIPRRRRPA